MNTMTNQEMKLLAEMRRELLTLRKKYIDKAMALHNKNELSNECQSKMQQSEAAIYKIADILFFKI